MSGFLPADFALLFFLIHFVSPTSEQAQSANPQRTAENAAQTAMPAEWTNRVETLAGKIADAVKASKTVSLDVQNLSSLGAGDAEMIHKALRAELQKHGIRIASSGTDVKVTLSENLERFIWIAEVHGKDEPRVFIASLEGKATGSVPIARKPVVLHRELIWQQTEPMMDFLVSDVSADGRPQMFVLEAKRIVSYRKENGEWKPSETFALPTPDNRPRDIRGLIDTADHLFTFKLSDVQCSGGGTVSFELKCEKGATAAWPLVAGGQDRGFMAIVEGRNYFGGDLDVYGDAEVEAPPFYSVAVMKELKGAEWILAEVDGKSRKYNDANEARAVYAGWGDDVVNVASGCGTDWQILASAPGDWTVTDRLQSYDVEHGAATASGEPLEFAGPILAMWPTLDAKAVRVVSKNLKTGEYEASIVSVSCAY